jgi:hypothetical protein
LLVVVSTAVLLPVAFIAGALTASAAVIMAASIMVIDVVTGMGAGGPMVSVRAGG